MLKERSGRSTAPFLLLEDVLAEISTVGADVHIVGTFDHRSNFPARLAAETASGNSLSLEANTITGVATARTATGAATRSTSSGGSAPSCRGRVGWGAASARRVVSHGSRSLSTRIVGFLWGFGRFRRCLRMNPGDDRLFDLLGFIGADEPLNFHALEFREFKPRRWWKRPPQLLGCK